MPHLPASLIPARQAETLQCLFRRVPSEDLIGSLVRLYDLDQTQRHAHEQALEFIEEIEPATTDAISSIVVDMISEEDGDTWANVSGIQSGYDGKLAIEFSPWPEWLPATVIRGRGAENLSDAEMLAHILWEMTWIGFDPKEIAERRTVSGR